MNKFFLFFYFFILQATAQTGISVSPPRIYFDSKLGGSNTQLISVTNVSATNTLDLAVSLGDWEYDEKGENQMFSANTLANSCANWISIKNTDNYFTLKPGERKELEITVTPPKTAIDTLAAHTAVLYVSQMNPVDDVDNKGTSIKVSIRSGIKIFHSYPENFIRKVEIEDLKYDQSLNKVNLKFRNQSKLWVDGKISGEIINTKTGKKSVLNNVVFYTLPGNLRTLSLPVLETLEKGSYNASIIIDYGDAAQLEMAELNFNYE
ncbi:fimbrial biogenesis chaperone [Flavobacterium algicola]|uniref:fimbrial biogenesis chaperone n=1 Tax=Flavobacterium algicola TaxID=556529 RepID=UPI001EFE4996|nr:molecular chaperone [Flavobacterium algicola]MCG9792153.1 molecular chaperone [Flavobacterium algicola]